jgi:hypothetical protein
MRQERIRKTPRRRSRRSEFPPLNVVPRNPDTGNAEDVLDRINSLLEAA